MLQPGAEDEIDQVECNWGCLVPRVSMNRCGEDGAVLCQGRACTGLVRMGLDGMLSVVLREAAVLQSRPIHISQLALGGRNVAPSTGPPWGPAADGQHGLGRACLADRGVLNGSAG